MQSLLFALLLAAPSTWAKGPDGAEVYRETCSRCHLARPPSEMSEEEWRAVVFHMRTRALLTRKEMLALEDFLGPPPPPPAAGTSRVLADPTVAAKCQSCHDVSRIDAAVSAGRGEADWRATLERMRAYGAKISPHEAAEMARWLAERSLTP